MDTCICMAKSLHCSLETITTLLVSYTPIQNKKFKKIKKNKSQCTIVKELYSKKKKKIVSVHRHKLLSYIKVTV